MDVRLGQRIVNDNLPLGGIRWLPRRSESEIHMSNPDKCEGVFDHPVIVVSNGSGKSVHVFVVTSRKGKPINDFTRKIRKEHIPIYPSEPHPDTGDLLFLEGGKSFGKASTVRVDKKRSVERAALRPCREGDLQLTPASISLMLNAHQRLVALLDSPDTLRTVSTKYHRLLLVRSHPWLLPVNPSQRSDRIRILCRPVHSTTDSVSASNPATIPPAPPIQQSSNSYSLLPIHNHVRKESYSPWCRGRIGRRLQLCSIASLLLVSVLLLLHFDII